MASKKPEGDTVKRITCTQLREKANKFLSSSKNANLLTEILDMFNKESNNYTPVLLTVELVFTQVLRRRCMYEVVEAAMTEVEPPSTPEAIYIRWLRDAYQKAMSCTISCLKRGDIESRVQALVTLCKLLREEGLFPLESCQGTITFPHIRLKDIFTALLDSEVSMSAVINRFQEYTEYRDIQQYGLLMLSLLAYSKAPSQIFIQNYLQLFEKLMSAGLPHTPRSRHEPHIDDQYYCKRDGKVAFVFNPGMCRRYINRCWGFACKWPLRASERSHRLALLLLVDRLMPYLARPQLVTDLLCDSLDCVPKISILALRGMLELVTKHKVDYPEIYDRLYAMFEPEIFATRSKARLLQLADVFLSSTRISEALMAAFAKRLSRLALIAPPEDSCAILALISTILARHPGLRRMVSHDHPSVMPKDPYVMEEACAGQSRAINSSLWEVAALRLHFSPEVSAAARRVLAVAEGTALPDVITNGQHEQFDLEIRKHFKSIEVNFVRCPNLSHPTPSCERLACHWNMAL